MNYSLEDQRKCVMREIAFRQRVYPRWVAGGKMTEKEAERQIALMRAVLQTLVEAERQLSLLPPAG